MGQTAQTLKNIQKGRLQLLFTDQSFSVSEERLLKCLLDHCILIGSESLSQLEYSDHLYILIVVLQKPKMIDQ